MPSSSSPTPYSSCSTVSPLMSKASTTRSAARLRRLQCRPACGHENLFGHLQDRHALRCHRGHVGGVVPLNERCYLVRGAHVPLEPSADLPCPEPLLARWPIGSESNKRDGRRGERLLYPRLVKRYRRHDAAQDQVTRPQTREGAPNCPEIRLSHGDEGINRFRLRPDSIKLVGVKDRMGDAKVLQPVAQLPGHDGLPGTGSPADDQRPDVRITHWPTVPQIGWSGPFGWRERGLGKAPAGCYTGIVPHW